MKLWRPVACVFFVVLTGTACHPSIEAKVPDARGAESKAALWHAPERGRDLFNGVGGAALAPPARGRFQVIATKSSGFSDGYTLLDERGREWSAKFPPEAQTEVVASRLLWGIGYHQVPNYVLADWHADNARTANPQGIARFRQKDIPLAGMKDEGSWSYYQNPFIGSRELAGLIVFHVMLGNSDLKDEQNVLYVLTRPREGARVWYVARDLGQTFGRSGLLNAPRNDIDAYERTTFIKGVENGRVRFNFGGRHGPLVENITVADVKWLCARLNALTDKQWRDAFRAGAYEPQLAERFIRRTRQKISEGLALTPPPPRSASSP